MLVVVVGSGGVVQKNESSSEASRGMVGGGVLLWKEGLRQQRVGANCDRALCGKYPRQGSSVRWLESDFSKLGQQQLGREREGGKCGRKAAVGY